MTEKVYFPADFWNLSPKHIFLPWIFSFKIAIHSSDNISTMLMNILKQHMEKRRYERHPAEIPVEYEITGHKKEGIHFTKNISMGGICFHSPNFIEPGIQLSFWFPSINPNSKLTGKVAWCAKKEGYAEVGIQFLDENEAYRAKLIQEICHLKDRQNSPS